MPVTEQDVLNVLKSSPRPLKAKEIAAYLTRKKGIRITRKDVNRVLHFEMKPKGVVSSDEDDKWRIPSEVRPAGSSTSSDGRPKSTPPRSPTYYEILEVVSAAHPRVIEKAYKALVGLYHPDRATPEERSEFEEKMKDINVAYETLSDEHKRREYDAKLRAEGGR